LWLLGGWGVEGKLNDIWKSNDNGHTWIKQCFVSNWWVGERSAVIDL
jgi:hypothetical protein